MRQLQVPPPPPPPPPALAPASALLKSSRACRSAEAELLTVCRQWYYTVGSTQEYRGVRVYRAQPVQQRHGTRAAGGAEALGGLGAMGWAGRIGNQARAEPGSGEQCCSAGCQHVAWRAPWCGPWSRQGGARRAPGGPTKWCLGHRWPSWHQAQTWRQRRSRCCSRGQPGGRPSSAAGSCLQGCRGAGVGRGAKFGIPVRRGCARRAALTPDAGAPRASAGQPLQEHAPALARRTAHAHAQTHALPHALTHP